jgi:hypothetical protein
MEWSSFGNNLWLAVQVLDIKDCDICSVIWDPWSMKRSGFIELLIQ